MINHTISEIEELYVKNTYNQIASSFDTTRYSIWNCVKEFIGRLKTDENVIEVGCGNGKNLSYMINNGFTNVRGCDFSTSFVEICKSKKLEVTEANILNLPFDDNSFNSTLCVAVIHHLSTVEHRIQAINELIRITKHNGHIFISVNSTNEFNKSSKHLDTANDIMVGWQNNYDRYYHLFERGELDELCERGNVEIINSNEECGNYYVVLRVTKD